MVIKSARLRARRKKYSSSESDSSVVLSESSNDSLPVLKPNAQIQESGTSKPISDGVFKSPVRKESHRLEMDKNKVTRTYGSKFVTWESIACSTPLLEKPACLKYTPLSPITNMPSPSEFLEEQDQENSNEWCTYLLEEAKSSSKERPSKSAAIAPQNKSLVSEKGSKNPSPFADMSPKVVEEVNEMSLKHINKNSLEQRNSRIAGSGSKNLSVSIKVNEKPVPNNSNAQNVEHDANLEVASDSSSSAGSKTLKNKVARDKENMHSNATRMKRRLTEAHENRVTWQSKSPEECISKSPAHSEKLLLAKNVIFLENEVCKNTTLVNEKQKENGERGNMSSEKHDNSNRNGERFGNVEAEIISEVLDKIPGSTEEFQQIVTSKIQDASQKSHENGKNLNPSKYRKTRSRIAKKRKSVNTDIVEDKQSVNSELPNDVSTISEEPNVSRINLVCVHPDTKGKEKEAQLSVIQERNSIERLSAGDVNNEPPSDASTTSEEPNDNIVNLLSVRSVVKAKEKEIQLSDNKQRKNSIKRLSRRDVDTEPPCDASTTSEEPNDNGLNFLSVRSFAKTKEKEIQLSDEKKRGHSVKRLSTRDVDTGVRKSKRQRLPPLQYWKGERAQYEPIYHPECKTLCKLVGVVRPREQEFSIQRKGDQQKKKQTQDKRVGHRKKDILSFSASVSPVNVKEIISMRHGKEIQDVECVAHYSKSAFEPFLLSSGKSVKCMTYQRCLSIDGLANGFLKITAGGSHQSEVNDDVDLLLLVVRGTLEVTINGQMVHARPGSSVIIPRGIQYKVENRSSSETLLSFVTKM